MITALSELYVARLYEPSRPLSRPGVGSVQHRYSQPSKFKHHPRGIKLANAEYPDALSRSLKWIISPEKKWPCGSLEPRRALVSIKHG